jgi:2-polyprenyl-6-methoxyphenol hydroxylase-like FAD-dependent oxidoreductase
VESDPRRGHERADPDRLDRVALLGDAGCCASPLSGHGTTLAVVGAYVLAGDYAVAFARYEHQLRPWVEEIHGSAKRWGGLMIPETMLGVRLRNDLARLLTCLHGKSLPAHSMTKMSNAFALQDYSTPARFPTG